MKAIAVSASAKFAEAKMQKVKLVSTAHMFADLYCLLPGQEQRRHAHSDSDKLYYVVRGVAEIGVGERRGRVVAGELVLAPAGEEHELRNPGPEPLEVMVLMSPPPVH